MQKITLRISALNYPDEEAAVRDLLGLLNQYRPAPGVILLAEGEPDLAKIFDKWNLSADQPLSKTQRKKDI
jgi:hypothetical protein